MGRRKKNALPQLRRLKARNRAFVEVEGARVYLGAYDDNGPSDAAQAAYDTFIAEYLGAGRQLPRSGESVLILEVVDSYWQHAKRRYSKNGKITSEAVVSCSRKSAVPRLSIECVVLMRAA